MLTMTLRDLVFRRRQFALAVIGTSLVFALALALTGMSAGFRTEARRTVESVGADAWLVPAGAPGPFTSFSVVPAGTVNEVARAPGVESAEPLVIFPGAVLKKGRFVGINVIGHTVGGIVAPDVAKGRAVRGPREAVVNNSLGLKVGQDANITGRRFRVVGIVHGKTYFAGVPIVYLSVRDAQDLAFGGQPLVSAVITKGEPRRVPSGLRLLSNDRVRADLLRPMKNPTKTIDNTRAFMWIVAAVIIGAVTYLSALERIRDFAVLKAVGGSSRSLVVSVGLQAVLASLLAAGLAALVANLIRPAFEIPLDITGPAYLALPVVAFVVGVLASLAALRRAVRVDPALAFAS